MIDIKAKVREGRPITGAGQREFERLHSTQSSLVGWPVSLGSRQKEALIVLLCALLFIFALSLSCAASSGQDAGANTDRQQLSKLIPDSLPAHVTSQGTPVFYTPDNLFQYMDGGADIFLVYGVRMLLHQDLRAGTSDIALDIFDMGSS